MPILILNCGSSSIKAALFQEETEILKAQVSLLDQTPLLELHNIQNAQITTHPLRARPTTLSTALQELISYFFQTHDPIEAVGHRVVHGGTAYNTSVRLTSEVIETLETLSPMAPLHQPYALEAARQIQKHAPHLPQVACFDTAFHAHRPHLDQIYALPYRYFSEGIRRYGFHGLSYESIVDRLHAQHLNPQGHYVIAHLGQGSSLCAISKGQSIATTMGFTALEGLPMATRSGSLDPGILLYWLKEKGWTAEQIEHILYQGSGLQGISDLSSDVRILEHSDDPQAQLAIDYFALRVAESISALRMHLPSFDGLIFTGGIGENSSIVREKILSRLSLHWDLTGRVQIIKTQEEKMIARHTNSVLKKNQPS